MKITASNCFPSLFLIFFTSGFASSSAHISYKAMEPRVTTSRALLQAKTSCSEDFANKNYTVITSQCKGPNYPADACCNSFKEFACPYSDLINNEKSDCAATMFSYINLYGRYPPGIFANMCKEGKDGLDCSTVKTQASRGTISYGAHTTAMIFGSVLVIFLLQMF